MFAPDIRSPQVGILMGSESDLPTVRKAFAVLDELGVSYEAVIASAHRTPERVVEFVRDAERRGARVFIAAAGGAAHLAGVVAAHTLRPVIGIPLKGWATEGLDALLSTVQMPRGVPVATVAIDGAVNAALLAARILALCDPALAERLAAYRQRLVDEVAAANRRLAECEPGSRPAESSGKPAEPGNRPAGTGSGPAEPGGKPAASGGGAVERL